MESKFYLTAILTLGLGSSFTLAPFQTVEAIPATTTPSSSTYHTNSAFKAPSATANQAREQDQMAAWMIEAAQVAKDYVDGLDKEQYAQSWEKSDPLFQKTISQKEWATALEMSRKPLGRTKSRTLKDQRPALDPHGLPKGPYMVVEYHTAFEKAPQSGELLTLRRDPDGRWRVLTYQVN